MVRVATRPSSDVTVPPRLIPITPVLRGGRFWIRTNGRLVATPLFVALVVVETSDLVFALDSVPAVLSITRDPFLVYASNVFAILGLRSLYFLLVGARRRRASPELGITGRDRLCVDGHDPSLVRGFAESPRKCGAGGR